MSVFRLVVMHVLFIAWMLLNSWQFLYLQVDMPVFFYIDPDIDTDPDLANVETITLSYTFFESTDPLSIPLPGFQGVQAAPPLARPQAA